MVVFQLPFITKTQPNTTGLFTCKKKGAVLKNFKDGKKQPQPLSHLGVEI